MNDSQWELAGLLVSHPNWRWVTGMRMRTPDEEVLGWYDGELPDNVWPDLTDNATGGVLVGVIDELGVLRDVAREPGDWIVAVELDGELKGWAADTLAEAAGWALIETWGPPDEYPED